MPVTTGQPIDLTKVTTDGNITLPTDNTTLFTNNFDSNGAAFQGASIATDNQNPNSGNTPLASGPDTNADPTAVQGDVPTLQTQVSNNIPDSGAPTAPPSSGTVIAQEDTPNGPVNPALDANPAGPVDPNFDVPPKQLNVEVNKQIGNPNVQPEQATTPPNDAPNPFADTLSKLQTVGGLVGAAASALARQQIPQSIQDAFNAFNKFLASPADPGLVDFADRQNGAVVGLAEGLELLPDLQIADSGSSTGFSSTEESLNNNPSQAFQESRQINNVIGFGLPFVLEGGGAGKPPASSPELVPAGPGAGIPVENPAPLVRAPETGPLETRVEKNQGNQGPLQSKNEDPNNQQGAGGDPLKANSAAENKQGLSAEGDLTKPALDANPTSLSERVNPRDIRFTQDTVSPNFSDGGTITDVVRGIRDGTIKVDDFPTIRVVESDGQLFTLDNRRLTAFNAAGVDNIPIQRVSLDDPAIANDFANKFRPIDEGKTNVVVPRNGRSDARRILREFGKSTN